MYWFTISVWAWTCLSFHTARPINLMCRAGLRAIIDVKTPPESFHVSMTYCAADYFSILLHPQKNTAFYTVFKKVSFGQPARQESDNNNNNNNCHNTLEKSFHNKRFLFFFRVCVLLFFSSSIMELQKSAALRAHAEKSWRKAPCVLLRLVDTGGFGSVVGYLAFNFWIWLITQAFRLKAHIT